jgi:predicted aspartyl protease
MSGARRSSVAELPKVVGSVDALGRPVVRVSIIGRDDEALATIDTGFNGALIATLGDALALGIVNEESSQTVRLGDESVLDVRLGRVRLSWLGEDREARVYVSPAPAVSSGPVLLIGTRLLTPHLLLVDFEANTVEIETQ